MKADDFIKQVIEEEVEVLELSEDICSKILEHIDMNEEHENKKNNILAAMKSFILRLRLVDMVEVVTFALVLILVPYGVTQYSEHNNQIQNENKAVNKNTSKKRLITITLTDNQEGLKSKDTISINTSIVHAYDIKCIIDILSGYGINEISVNDEKVDKDSEIVASGQFIKINEKNYGPPYIIKSVCKYDSLSAELILKNDAIKVLKLRGIIENIEETQ